MKIETKISGWSIREFDIKPIFTSQMVWLSDAMKVIKRQETMNFLLDEFRFAKGCEEREGDWVAILDWDTILKLSVMENYPDYEKEFISHFGENWARHYLRFNH